MVQEMISGNALLELIPQREPMVMIDRYCGQVDGVSHAGLHIADGNIFCEDGVLQEYGLIEHIAQSAAARVGFECRVANRNIPVGFIGSVDKMSIYALPSVGKDILSEIRIEQEVGNISLISAQVVCEGEVVAEGRMKIFLNREEE